MIIYGTKATKVAQELVTDKCPHCGTANSIEMNVFQKYAHVFWIPFFPIGKTGISQCAHCKQVLKLKEMPSGLQAAYERLKPQGKTPAWTFSGLAIVVALVAIGIYSDGKKDAKNKVLITAPQKGDVYEVKTDTKMYTLYKVYAIEGDSVVIQPNNLESNKISGLRNIRAKGDASYSEEMYAFHKKELQAMLEKGEIMDIERK